VHIRCGMTFGADRYDFGIGAGFLGGLYIEKHAAEIRLGTKMVGNRPAATKPGNNN